MKFWNPILVITLLSLSSCYISFGQRSQIPIKTLPAEMCVASALSGIAGISDVKVVQRTSEEVQLLLPRRIDTRQRETVVYTYKDHEFYIESGVTMGLSGQATLFGVAGGQCPPPDYLQTFAEVRELVEPVLSGECFDNVPFVRNSNGKCPLQ